MQTDKIISTALLPYKFVGRLPRRLGGLERLPAEPDAAVGGVAGELGPVRVPRGRLVESIPT